MNPWSPLLLLLPAASAADAGHYHPDAVAAKSALFVEAAGAMGPAFDEAQSELTRLGAALETLDAGVLLLGERAPDALRDWAGETRKRTTGWYLQIQRHVGLLQEDFSGEFGGALARALEAQEGPVQECGATGIAAIMGGKKQCPGADLNATLAEQLDQDPQLQAFVAEIADVPWPQSTVSPRTWAPVAITGTERWVSADAVLSRFASGALDRRAADLEAALEPLEEGLERGEPGAVERGQGARDAYAGALAADGALLWEAMAGALTKAEKKGGPAGVGVCPVPASLGGCEGEDATRAVLDTLAADKRFGKAVAPLR